MPLLICVYWLHYFCHKFMLSTVHIYDIFSRMRTSCNLYGLFFILRTRFSDMEKIVVVIHNPLCSIHETYNIYCIYKVVQSSIYNIRYQKNTWSHTYWVLYSLSHESSSLTSNVHFLRLKSHSTKGRYFQFCSSNQEAALSCI